MSVVLIIIMTLRIISSNCNGLNMYSKRALLFNYLINNSIDICCLQETHAADSFISDSWVKSWRGKVFGCMEPITVGG